jgi:two-component system LytT family response regulator
MGAEATIGRIRVLIVDDESRARATIRSLLQLDDEVEVVGETYGEQTPALISELLPDLVFLDVQMPRLDGLQVLASLDPNCLPLIVFVTAYDEYAVQAFEHAAVDYLLKPFSDRRFFQALNRAKDVIRRREADVALRRLVALLTARLDRAHLPVPPHALQSGQPSVEADRLVLRDSGRILLIPNRDIRWIEAKGAYVRVHTVQGGIPVVRESLGAIETRLDSRVFFRIHRSAIVNIHHVREVRTLTHGDCEIALSGGQKLKLSRTRRGEFEQLLGNARN